MSALEVVVVHRIELASATLAVIERVAGLLHAALTPSSAGPGAATVQREDGPAEASAASDLPAPPSWVGRVAEQVAENLAGSDFMAAVRADAAPTREMVVPAEVAPPPVVKAVEPPVRPTIAARTEPVFPTRLVVWSMERKTLLASRYPKGESLDSIWEALNALPGPPIARDRIAIQAHVMGASRPTKPGQQAARADTLAAARGGLPPDDLPVDAEEIDWPAALQWAEQNRVDLGAVASDAQRKRAINAARVAAGLARWHIVKQRIPMEQLPANNV